MDNEQKVSEFSEKVVEFSAKCPQCGTKMAESNTFCSISCYKIANGEEVRI